MQKFFLSLLILSFPIIAKTIYVGPQENFGVGSFDQPFHIDQLVNQLHSVATKDFNKVIFLEGEYWFKSSLDLSKLEGNNLKLSAKGKVRFLGGKSISKEDISQLKDKVFA